MGITYQLTGLPDNATSEQITAAFREQYPNVPLMAGIRAADYDKGKIWQYSGTAWIQLTSLNIDKATSTSLGVVKGSETSTTNEGKIFVEVDGTMAVIGWDTLKALATAAKQSVDNLEPRVTQQSAKIDALEGDVAANAADITALQGTSADHESRISSLETTSANLGTRMGTAETDIDTLQASDTQQTSKISALETTSANQGSKISSLETTSANLDTRISSLETTSANLGTRMGTAETDIDTLQASDAQQTSKISALESDMNNVKPRVGQLESDVGTLETKVDQHTQSISGLSTDINGLKTSKQNKLTAGENIQIKNDVISATIPGGKTVYTGSFVNLFEKTSNSIRLKKDIDIEFINIGGNFVSKGTVSLKKFEQSALPYRTMIYLCEVKTNNLNGRVLYRYETQKLTIDIGSNTIEEPAFDDYQIKTESGNVIIDKTAYFRVFA